MKEPTTNETGDNVAAGDAVTFKRKAARFISRDYGTRMRDFLPFINPLSDFVDKALEQGNNEFELYLDGEEGFRDMNDSKSTWTVTAKADGLKYVESGSSVPSISTRGSYRGILEDLGSRIENEANEDISYTVKYITVEKGVSMY